MVSPQNSDVRRPRLLNHFAVAIAAASLATAVQAEVITWNCGLVVPVNFEGIYINVEAQTSGNSSTSGWDMNPYGWTNVDLYWYNAAGCEEVQGYGATGAFVGTANLAIGTVVSSASTFGSGQSSEIYGGWQPNTTNYVGFRFNAGDGSLHYGYGEVAIGASIGQRTIVALRYESVAGAAITVTSGGPPPAYDPCAAGNPGVSIGANNLFINPSAADLAVGGSCAFTAFKANYFKFTPPVTGEYSFSTCASGLDTSIAVLDGCAAGSAVLGCDNNYCGVSSRVSVTLSSLSTYYFVVGGSLAAVDLPSSVAVEVVSPASPACASADTMVFGYNGYDCNFSPIDQNVVNGTSSWIIYKAKWFAFTPTVTGMYTISACGSYGDTKLAIGTACPGVGGSFAVFAYNDDQCACGSGCGGGAGTSNWSSRLDSSNSNVPLTQPLVAGQTYHVIIGTYANGQPASVGGLTIDGPPPAQPCPADLNQDGVVNGADLGIMLSVWGVCPSPCAADLNHDGVVNGADLGILLAAWGACP